MNTPSHLIINAALYKKAGRKDIPQSAILLGSIMPDIPLGLLSLGFFLYNRFVLGQPGSNFMPKAFDDLFFNNPWWIAFHNFLHSPIALLIYIVILWQFRSKTGTKGHWWLWFVAGCLVHTTIDVFTHVTDGPLLFWPFEWHIRFHSIISYYDRAYYGQYFSIFELALDVVLLGYLFLPKLWRKLKKSAG